MLHPLLHLLATQPHLLGNHAHAYGELVGTELSQQTRAWGKRTVLVALALCFLGVAGVLCGTSFMLWAVAAPQITVLPSALIVAPLVPTVLSLACLWASRADPSPDKKAFAELRRQVQADVALLREMGTP